MVAVPIPSEEQVRAAVGKLEDLGQELAHQAGLTSEENYRGWVPVVWFLGLAFNKLQQWRTDFAARWNSTPVINDFPLHGTKWFYGGFVVDNSDPRSAWCTCIVPPYSGVQIQVGQTTNSTEDTRGSIDQFWDDPTANGGNYNDNPWTVVTRPLGHLSRPLRGRVGSQSTDSD